MTNLGDSHQDQPGLVRIGFAASCANMRPGVFEDACERGVIPIEVIRVSERLAYVRATELNDFLKGRPHE